MARRVVSKSELARIAGVAKPSISLACQKSFPRALVGNGVDVDHADVQKYLTGKPGALTRLAEFFALGPSQPTATRPAASPAPTNSPAERAATRRYAPPSPAQQVDVEALLDLTLREIIATYGSVPSLGQVLDAVHKSVGIREREIKIAVSLKKLVSRELVQSLVFGPLEALFRALFTDFAITSARRVHALGRSGAAVEEAEALVRGLLKQLIGQAKRQIVDGLRSFDQEDFELPGNTAAQQSSDAVEYDEHAP